MASAEGWHPRVARFAAAGEQAPTLALTMRNSQLVKAAITRKVPMRA